MQLEINIKLKINKTKFFMIYFLVVNIGKFANFFENRSTDYARGALKGNWGDVWK